MASLKKNYFYSLTAQLLLILMPIVTTPYLSRVLGETNLGVYNYILSIVNYFILFGCVGLNLYGQRETAARQNDPVGQSAVFFELLAIRAVTLGVSSLIYFSVLTPRTEFPYFYRLMGIELIASFFDISWFYQGNENFKLQSLRTVFTRLISIVCVFVFVRSKDDLDRFMLCYALAVLLGNLSLWLPLKKYLTRVPKKTLRLKRHFLPVLVMFLPQIATNVYTQLDKTMIGLLTGHDYAQVTYYSQAEKIVKIAMTVITAVGSIMLSRVAAVLAENDEAQAKDYIRKSFRFMMLLACPMAVGIAASAADFVPWFFGEGYESVIPCMALLSPLVLLISTSNILGTQYLLPARRMRDYTLSVLAGMAVNCALNALLIPRWKSLGAVAATLVAETAVAAVQFFFLRGTFSLRLFVPGLPYVPAAAVMGAAIWGLSLLLPAKIYATVLEATLGVVLYFVLLLLFRDRFLLEQLQSVLPERARWFFAR